MNFRITGLSPEPFRPLFGLSDEALASHGIRRYAADRVPGYPDRIELRDVGVGETVLLLNYVHQPAATPYHASHAIFVREGADSAYDAIGEVPPSLRTRLLSLRAFDATHFLVDADVADGEVLENTVARLLSDPNVAYVQAHYAKYGCYAARIERA